MLDEWTGEFADVVHTEQVADAFTDAEALARAFEVVFPHS